jgi:hypothetical protein
MVTSGLAAEWTQGAASLDIMKPRWMGNFASTILSLEPGVDTGVASLCQCDFYPKVDHCLVLLQHQAVSFWGLRLAGTKLFCEYRSSHLTCHSICRVSQGECWWLPSFLACFQHPRRTLGWADFYFLSPSSFLFSLFRFPHFPFHRLSVTEADLQEPH